MKIKVGILVLTLLLALNGIVSADLIGDSVGGSLTGLNSLNINSQFNSPAIVGSGDEFQGHASNYYSGYGWMYWDIYVNVNESSFQVRIDDPKNPWGQDISHNSGILELRLSDLDWVGAPGSVIDSVSLVSFSRDYPEFWTPGYTIMTLTWDTNAIYMKFRGIADNDIYNFQVNFSGTGNPVPEPSLMVLLSISVLSLAGLKSWWKG